MTLLSRKPGLNNVFLPYRKQPSKSLLLEGKKVYFYKTYESWHTIERANRRSTLTEKTKYLSESAIIVLAIIVEELHYADRVMLNHEQLSLITKRARKQNQRIIEQLGDVLEINYHNSVTYGDRKYRYSYEFRHKLKRNEDKN